MHSFYNFYYKYSSRRRVKFKIKNPPQKTTGNFIIRIHLIPISPSIIHVIGISVLQIIEVCNSAEIIEVHVV